MPSRRILSEIEARAIRRSELSAAKLARLFGVSERRIYQIRPIGQPHNTRNSPNGRRPLECQVCGGELQPHNFLTDGNGYLVEVCERGHWVRA